MSRPGVNMILTTDTLSLKAEAPSTDALTDKAVTRTLIMFLVTKDRPPYPFSTTPRLRNY